jgi:KTSC domain
MERKAVESSQITSIGYDAKTKTLEVEFAAGGSVYRYALVPAAMYKSLMEAKSIGGYFSMMIKGSVDRFPATKVSEGVRKTDRKVEKKVEKTVDKSVPEMTPGLVTSVALTMPERARRMTIRDNVDYSRAAEFLKSVKALRAEVDGAFDPIISKAHEAHREALAQKKIAEKPLIEAERVIKHTIGWYLNDMERARRAEEDARRIKHEAEIRAQAEEENLKRAQELADAGDMEGAAEAVDAEVMVPEIPVYVESSVVKVAGISARKSYYAEVTDLMQLVRAVAEGRAPIQCLQANMAFLNAQARAFKKAGGMLDNKFEPRMGVEVKESDTIAAGK